MFGNILNNNAIKKLIDAKSIEIRPFDAKLLKTCHYPLHPLALMERQDNNSEKVVHNFISHKAPYTLQAGQYVIVEIKEHIYLDDEIIGKFTPASQLIENGLILVAGRIENPFGKNGEKIRFGIHNASKIPSEIRPDDKLAYIEFMDFRGLNNLPVTYTRKELELFARRYAAAADDGVFYE